MKCWCGLQTEVRVMPDVGITDTAKTSVRVCPVHGEFWKEKP